MPLIEEGGVVAALLEDKVFVSVVVAVPDWVAVVVELVELSASTVVATRAEPTNIAAKSVVFIKIPFKKLS